MVMVIMKAMVNGQSCSNDGGDDVDDDVDADGGDGRRKIDCEGEADDDE